MNLNFTSAKYAQSSFLKRIMPFSMICLTAAFIASCKKTSNNTVTQTPSSVMVVINASPDAPASDFYLGSQRINATPFTYGNYLGYFNAGVGSGTFGFFDSGTLTPIATDTITLQQNKAYSIFFTNVVSSATFVVLKDTVTRPASNTATIRLVNVSPDAPAVDLVIKGTTYVTNKTYKQASSFVAIPVASNDTLQIRQTGTTTVLASVPAVTISSGSVYTIWLYGFANPPQASEKLAAGLMNNAIFN